MNSPKLRGRSPVVTGILGAAALLALGIAGCANRVYNLRTLPEQFHPRPVVNPRTLDLAPFAGPPVNPELIDVGDKLSISITAGLDEETSSSLSVRVGDDGTALLSEIGTVRLAGLHPMAAEQQIAMVARQRDVYRQPSVTVAVEDRRTNTVTIMGAVNRAAVVAGVRQDTIHEIPWRSCYLKTAIDAAGGLADSAGTKVWIWRPAVPQGEPQLVVIDLTDLNHRSRGSPYLTDGTVITVDERPPRPVQVEGLVAKPGPVEYSVVYGLRLSEAVGMAGGPSSRLASDAVISRQGPQGQERCDIKVNLDKDTDKNCELMPGDVVRVKQTPATWGLDLAQTFLRFSVGSSVALW